MRDNNPIIGQGCLLISQLLSIFNPIVTIKTSRILFIIIHFEFLYLWSKDGKKQKNNIQIFMKSSEI